MVAGGALGHRTPWDVTIRGHPPATVWDICQSGPILDKDDRRTVEGRHTDTYRRASEGHLIENLKRTGRTRTCYKSIATLYSYWLQIQ